MKKRLLSCIVCICMVLCSLNAVVFAKDSETIVILYENDVHCAVEGYSKLAAMKNELKSEYEYVGVVSSGDFVQGGTLGAVSKGEYIVELMNLVGYDAIAPGNHEFDYTISRLTELYELWCAGDEAALKEYMKDDLSDMTAEEKALYQEYQKAMETDRNKHMAEVAIEYLESGETVFYAVGLAHVIADDGLVNALRDAGYTVELVTYE